MGRARGILGGGFVWAGWVVRSVSAVFLGAVFLFAGSLGKEAIKRWGLVVLAMLVKLLQKSMLVKYLPLD